MNNTRKRVYGLLVGCAYGDAMGMPSEMMDKETFIRAFPQGINTFMGSTPYDFIQRNFTPYEVTDDTINTLIVCDSIIKNKGQFVVEDYLEELLNWIKNNASKCQYIVGPSTKRALEQIEKGIPITETGKQGTTNGTCMKVAPLGIVCNYSDLEKMIRTVEQLCLPTHNTNISITSASIVAGVVSYFLRGGNDFEFMWDLIFNIEEYSKNYGNKLPGPSLRKRLEIVKSRMYTIPQLQELFGSGMECIETLPMVLAILMESNFNPRKTAQLAANLYGDTDTIGSIATGIAGAYCFDFPTKDILCLEEVNKIDFKQYADKLVDFIC